jgi:tetratricopeptide (TPR) repeat protein
MKIIGAVLVSFLLIGVESALADDAADCQSAPDAAQAVAACTRIIGSGTLTGHNLALAYNHRGLATSRTGQVRTVISDLNQAITLDPSHVAFYNDLGLALLQAADNDGAFAVFDRAVAVDPSFAIGYGNRGLARQRKNQNEQAIADFTRAIEINPALADAVSWRGISYAALHDYDRAIADYDAALKLLPDNLDVLNNRADAWRNKRVFAKALDDLDHAIRIKPTYAEAYYTRGETYKDMGDRERALAEIHKAIDLDKAGTYRAYGEKLIAELGGSPAVTNPPVQTADNNPPIPIGHVAAAEKRVALVIGNSAYQAVELLPNPTRDAETVAAAFRQDGFSDVIVVHDAGRSSMIDALKAFAKEADVADWAVIYYAGHGMEMAGENYLVPVDAKLVSDRDVPDEAISLDRVLSAVEGAHKLRLVVLDACRNNPFLAKMQVTSATRAISRGLARVEPSQATLVAYAAKDGSIASDGDKGSSPFAASFAKHVLEGGVEINKVFRLVRADVLAATGNAQEPFVYGSLPPEDFFFVPPKS